MDIGKIRDLREQGYTFESIASLFNVSRQAVHQALYGTSREYHRRYLLKINGVYVRVKKRPRTDDVCELCGKVVRKLDYHHWDDKHPECGIWVCLRCHQFVARLEKGQHLIYFAMRARISY